MFGPSERNQSREVAKRNAFLLPTRVGREAREQHTKVALPGVAALPLLKIHSILASMNQAAQYSGQAIERFAAEQEASVRASIVKPELQSGRILSAKPFGMRESHWGNSNGDDTLDGSESLSRSEMLPPGGRPRGGPGEASQMGISRAAHGVWGSHPSIAARATSVALDTENQPDIKPVIGWYDQNPGEEALKQLATMQARLNQRLGPEYISQRPGGGGMARLHYLEGWKAIDLANDVFGFNGWSTDIRQLTTDFMDVSPDGHRVNCGVTAIVRVFLRDGTYHDDAGFGHCENAKGKAAALEKAKKEAVTDAMKRALRTFGRLVGNCLYDKKYVATVSKMTPKEETFNPADMHRRQDYAAPPPAAARPATANGSHDVGAPSAHSAPHVQTGLATNGPAVRQKEPSPPTSDRVPLSRRASTSPIKPSPGTSSSPEELERIKAERQAIAAQRQAAFRQRQEEAKKGAAAALERRQNASPANANGAASTSSGQLATSVASADTHTTIRPQPPAPLKRAPAAALSPEPPKQMSADPASRAYAKEPGARWSSAAQHGSNPPPVPPLAQDSYDESDLTAMAESWDGGLSQEQKTSSVGHFVDSSAPAAGVKRSHGDSPREPLKNVATNGGGGAQDKRRRF